MTFFQGIVFVRIDAAEGDRREQLGRVVWDLYKYHIYLGIEIGLKTEGTFVATSVS